LHYSCQSRVFRWRRSIECGPDRHVHWSHRHLRSDFHMKFIIQPVWTFLNGNWRHLFTEAFSYEHFSILMFDFVMHWRSTLLWSAHYKSPDDDDDNDNDDWRKCTLFVKETWMFTCYRICYCFVCWLCFIVVYSYKCLNVIASMFLL